MIDETPVIFHSYGVPLLGRFLRDTRSLQDRQPAVIQPAEERKIGVEHYLPVLSALVAGVGPRDRPDVLDAWRSAKNRVSDLDIPHTNTQ
jgi:hypothetical protein